MENQSKVNPLLPADWIKQACDKGRSARASQPEELSSVAYIRARQLARRAEEQTTAERAS